TRDNTGAEVYCTIFALAESYHERDVLWAGTDDGLVHLSRDHGRTWQRVTPPELPEWALVSVLEPSPHDAATCYVAATCYKLDDTRPYLFKTSDYGRTWKRITNSLPEGEITRPGREFADRMVGSIGYAYRQVEAPTGEKKERLLDAGENPPNGAVVHYWLKEAPPGDVTLSFLDAEGRQIRSFSRSADGSSAPKD